MPHSFCEIIVESKVELVTEAEKLKYPKDLFNTRYNHRKKIMILDAKEGRIDLLLRVEKESIGKFTLKSLSYFLNRLELKQNISIQQEPQYSMTVYKELTEDESSERIDACETDNFFDSNDKRLILLASSNDDSETEDEEEGEPKRFYLSKNLEDVRLKIKQEIDYNAFQEESDFIINYSDHLMATKKEIKKFKFKFPYHYIVSADDTETTNTQLLLLGEVFYYCRILRKRKYLSVDAEQMIARSWRNPASYVNEIRGGLLIVKHSEKFITSDDDDIPDLLRRWAQALWKSRGETIVMFIFDPEVVNQLSKVTRYFEPVVGFRQLLVQAASVEGLVAKIQNLALEKYALKIEPEVANKLIDRIKEKGDKITNDIVVAERIIEDLMFKRLLNKPFNVQNPPVLSLQELAHINFLHNVDDCSNPFDELNGMIGLSNIKDKIKEISSYVKVQQEKKRLGKTTEPLTLHMQFVGNPGTAKTTVARLVGKILKQIGFLKKGDFFEVGREDLIAQYVGWTARTVSRKVEEALGSVLFIDEAYSLYDQGKGGGFEAEAVATLVKEMENHRDELVVILAGYPEEMQEFVGMNPGLKDRIAFTLEFPDYTEEELLTIFQKYCQDTGYVLEVGVVAQLNDYLREILSQKTKDWGNARYVRKVFERTRLKQAERLADLKEQLTEEALGEITLSDLQAALADSDLRVNIPQVSQRTIGFASR